MDFNPYESRSSSEPDESDEPAGLEDLPRFVSARVRAIIVTCLFTLFIVCLGTLAFSRFSQSMLLDRAAHGEPIDAAEATASDALIRLLSLIRISFFVACAIMTLVWVYRSHRNLRALGAERLEFTSGWAVGWWFVPFAQWVRPYQVMREIWLASNPKFVGDKAWRWRNGSTSFLIPMWWLCALAWSVFNYISVLILEASIATSRGDLPKLISASNRQGFADLFGFVPTLLFMAVVWSIDKRQAQANEAVESLTAGSGDADAN